MSKTDSKHAGLPLNAIRVFVETARCLNFGQAARTLRMTQSGVSHHIATLERHLERPLFVRRRGPLALTDAGRLYFDAIQEAMGTIELATQHFSPPQKETQRLIVRTSLPSFAVAVLIPALPRFQSCFPAQAPLRVDLVTSLSEPRPGEEYDVLVSRDLTVGNDDAQWNLLTEELVCVASPSVCATYAKTPVDGWPFIVARSRPDTFASWAARQSLDAPAMRITATFEHYFMAIPAAIADGGFLVVPRILVIPALSDGQLQESGLPALRSDACYKAYVNPDSRAQQAATAFCRWLKGELLAQRRPA